MKLTSVIIKDKFGSPFDGAMYTFGDLVTMIVNNAPIIAGVFLLFGIMAAGFGVMSGSSQNNPEAAAKAKAAATWGFVGFIVIFSAYWIVRILEIVTDTTFITNPGI